MNLSGTLRGIEASRGRAVLEITEDWLQGRSCFGGLQVALGVHAMRTLVDGGLPLRSLQVTFLAPVPLGQVEAVAQLLRTGKSATHVAAQLRLNGEVLALLVGIFGSARPSTVARTPVAHARETHPPLAMPYLPNGPTPSFTQHFNARWIRGQLPFSGDTLSDSVVVLDLRDPGPMTEGHVIAIADFIPPVALSQLSRPTPGSSMNWMLEFVRHDFATMEPAGWRIEAELVAAQDGYTSQSTLIFAPDGGLVAISRQSMVVFG